MREVKPHLLVCAWGMLCFALSAPGGKSSEPPLCNEDVVKLVKAGLSEEFIVEIIGEAEAVVFDLKPQDLEEMRRMGVSGTILEAMSRRSRSAGRLPATLLLQDGTPVRLVRVRGREIPRGEGEEGERWEVAAPVLVQGRVVIEEGTFLWGSLSPTSSSQVVFLGLPAADGRLIPLRRQASPIRQVSMEGRGEEQGSGEPAGEGAEEIILYVEGDHRVRLASGRAVR